MSLLSRCASTLRAFFGRGRLERDMDAELRFHMAAFVADQVRDGTAADEAERRARIEFGAVETFKEDCREARGLRFFDEVRQDLRYTVRMLRKSPVFTLITTVTLALGIGANTCIFTLVNAWVLQPLPYPDGDRLVRIWNRNRQQGRVSSVSAGDLNDWRTAKEFFDGFAAWNDASFALAGPSDPERIVGARVSWEFFWLLGVQPARGRNFEARDDDSAATPVAILSDSLWRSHFAAEPGVVGRTIDLDGRPVTVIGILPPNFLFPLVGQAGIWTPLALSPAERHDRATQWLRVLAKMKPGVTVARAEAFLGAWSQRLAQAYPATNTNRGIWLRTLREEVAQQAQHDSILILFGIVGCVLLIACTNVANLMFGRAAGRQREMALRLAIGAGRLRLMRQLLTENLILFLLGATFGILLAVWGLQWLVNSIPADLLYYLPKAGKLTIDSQVLLYTLTVAVMTGLVFGFAPAFHCVRVTVSDRLKESARASASHGSGRLRKALVVFEIALALLVLIATGLLTKSMIRMYRVDPGFDNKNLITARISLSKLKYSEKGRSDEFYRDVLERIRRVPSVKAAAASQFIPFGNSNSMSGYFVEGRRAPKPGEVPLTEFSPITPDYLRALGLPVIRGRFFNEQDQADSPPVLIINHTMAHREWPGEDAIGKRIRFGRNAARIWTIVGIVPDVKLSDLKDPPEAQIYMPFHQSPGLSMFLVIRSAAGLPEISGDIRKAVAAVDRSQPVYDMATMEQRIVVEHMPDVIMVRMMTLFGMISLFLAAIGIYGVISYSVDTRRQEIGVRMALGARTRHVLSLVLSQGLRLTTLGLAIGLAGAIAATRLLGFLLFQVSPLDLATFATVSGVLGVVALVACYLPARRAAKLDPVVTLRYE